jgi:hypothetical protein
MTGFGAVAAVLSTSTLAWAGSGTIKVDGPPYDSGSHANQPHSLCPVAINAFGATGVAQFEMQAPTGTGSIAATAVSGGFVLDIPPTAKAQPQQGYHLKVTMAGKSKVFWTNVCAPEGSNGGSGGTGGTDTPPVILLG